MSEEELNLEKSNLKKVKVINLIGKKTYIYKYILNKHN